MGDRAFYLLETDGVCGFLTLWWCLTKGTPDCVVATTSGLDLDEVEDEEEAFLDASFLGPFFLPPFFFPPLAEPEDERRTFSDSGSSPVESALAVRT